MTHPFPSAIHPLPIRCLSIAHPSLIRYIRYPSAAYPLPIR
ncbi:MAG: hypothetical protein NZM11_01245 [Anaerolineales bacterium]|nr:hypothetical protein [Anaerolineales bacterium]